jgi:selenocysteine-specific translation elongation factor
MIVVATKIDAVDEARLEELGEHARALGLEFFAISAVTGAGVVELKRRVGQLLEEIAVAGDENADGEEPTA